MAEWLTGPQRQLPTTGAPTGDVLSAVQSLSQADPYENGDGRVWGGIYHDHHSPGGKALVDLQAEVHRQYISSNALYPDSWPSVVKFQAEAVAMVVNLLHGPEAVGLLTSGGTESILLAMLAYRESGRVRGIDRPEIICALTAHASLHKACHLFGMKAVTSPVDVTQRLDPQGVLNRITPNTVAIYASAPTFPHGVIDPIEALGRIASEKGVGLHVDNCLGGILLSHLQREGLLTKRWDFNVPGVTTISVDIHKYGYAAKGASVVAFRDAELRRLTYLPVTDVSSPYITPTLQGARSGAVVAVAWATLMHMGEGGYRDAARRLHDIHSSMCKVVRETPGIRLLTDAELCIVPIASDHPNVDTKALARSMQGLGWNMFTSRDPTGVSLCVGEQHKGLIQAWAGDLRNSVQRMMDRPTQTPVTQEEAGVYQAPNVPLTPEAKVRLDRSMRDFMDRQFVVAKL